jgi:hypothetical protein
MIYDMTAAQIQDEAMSISLNAYASRSPTSFKDAAQEIFVFIEVLKDGMKSGKYDAEMRQTEQHKLVNDLTVKANKLLDQNHLRRK